MLRTSHVTYLRVCCRERDDLATMRDRQAADFQAELHEELLAQKAGLEQQQHQQQAQLDKEKAVVRCGRKHGLSTGSH